MVPFESGDMTLAAVIVFEDVDDASITIAYNLTILFLSDIDCEIDLSICDVFRERIVVHCEWSMSN